MFCDRAIDIALARIQARDVDVYWNWRLGMACFSCLPDLRMPNLVGCVPERGRSATLSKSGSKDAGGTQHHGISFSQPAGRHVDHSQHGSAYCSALRLDQNSDELPSTTFFITSSKCGLMESKEYSGSSDGCSLGSSISVPSSSKISARKSSLQHGGASGSVLTKSS